MPIPFYKKAITKRYIDQRNKAIDDFKKGLISQKELDKIAGSMSNDVDYTLLIRDDSRTSKSGEDYGYFKPIDITIDTIPSLGLNKVINQKPEIDLEEKPITKPKARNTSFTNKSSYAPIGEITVPGGERIQYNTNTQLNNLKDQYDLTQYALGGRFKRKYADGGFVPNITEQDYLPTEIVPNNTGMSEQTNWEAVNADSGQSFQDFNKQSEEVNKSLNTPLPNNTSTAKPSLGAFTPVGAENVPVTGNRMLDQANASMAQDKKLRKNIVGGVASASKMLDMVVPGLGTGVSTGLNAVNSFANGGDMTYQPNIPLSTQMNFGALRNTNVDSNYTNNIFNSKSAYNQNQKFNTVASAFAAGGQMTTIPNGAGKHEESSLGGVPIGPNNLVEENEVLIKSEGGQLNDTKDFVLSNRLGPMGSKKSYADIANKLKKKTLLRGGNDPYDKKYVEKETNKLAEDQEAQKQYQELVGQAQGITNNIMALGGYMSGKNTLADGGFTQSYPRVVYDENGNIVTYPETNVAKRNYYPNLNTKLNTNLNYKPQVGLTPLNTKGEPNAINPNASQPFNPMGYTNRENPFGNLSSNNPPISGEISGDPLGDFYRNTPDAEDMNKTVDNPTGDDWKTPPDKNKDLLELKDTFGRKRGKGKKKIDWKKGIPYAQLLGPATQMITSLRRNQDLANLNYRTGEYNPIDEFYASNLARKADNTKMAIADAGIRNIVNTQGTNIAARLAAQSQQLDAPNQEANLALQANMQNNQGRNAYEANKAATMNRNIDERERLLDNSRTQFTNSIYNAGANAAGAYKTNKMYDQTDINNERGLNMLASSGIYGSLDAEGNWISKTYQKYGGKLRKNC